MCTYTFHSALQLTHLATHHSQAFPRLHGIMDLHWWPDSQRLTTLHKMHVEVSRASYDSSTGQLLLESLASHHSVMK